MCVFYLQYFLTFIAIGLGSRPLYSKFLDSIGICSNLFRAILPLRMWCTCYQLRRKANDVYSAGLFFTRYYSIRSHFLDFFLWYAFSPLLLCYPIHPCSSWPPFFVIFLYFCFKLFFLNTCNFHSFYFLTVLLYIIYFISTWYYHNFCSVCLRISRESMMSIA